MNTVQKLFVCVVLDEADMVLDGVVIDYATMVCSIVHD